MTITNKELKRLAIKYWRDLQYEDFDSIKYLVGELVDLIDLEQTDQVKLTELVEQLEDHADEDCEPTTEPKAVVGVTNAKDFFNNMLGGK